MILTTASATEALSFLSLPARRSGMVPPEPVCAIHNEANGLPLGCPVPRQTCILTSISSNLNSLQSTLYIA